MVAVVARAVVLVVRIFVSTEALEVATDSARHGYPKSEREDVDKSNGSMSTMPAPPLV